MPTELPPARNAWEQFSYLLSDLLGFGPRSYALPAEAEEEAA